MAKRGAARWEVEGRASSADPIIARPSGKEERNATEAVKALESRSGVLMLDLAAAQDSLPGFRLCHFGATTCCDAHRAVCVQAALAALPADHVIAHFGLFINARGSMSAREKHVGETTLCCAIASDARRIRLRFRPVHDKRRAPLLRRIARHQPTGAQQPANEARAFAPRWAHAASDDIAKVGSLKRVMRSWQVIPLKSPSPAFSATCAYLKSPGASPREHAAIVVGRLKSAAGLEAGGCVISRETGAILHSNVSPTLDEEVVHCIALSNIAAILVGRLRDGGSSQLSHRRRGLS